MLARKRTEQVIIESESTEHSTPLYGLALSDLARVLGVGAIVGLIVWLVASLLFKFVFSPVLCRPIAPSDCHLAPSYGLVAGLIIANIIGLIMLVRMRLYRPLLAVIAAAVALWPFAWLVTNLPWGWTLLAYTIVWALGYALFAWIARTKSFILAIVLTVIAVFLVRLAQL